MESTYDADFYDWAYTQAALLRSGRIEQADIEHIAEEIEGMAGASCGSLITDSRGYLHACSNGSSSPIGAVEVGL